MSRIYAYPGAHNPTTYEWENRIADPDHAIEAFIASIIPWHGATIVDIGSGSAFHAARYATVAAHVYAVEPAPAMLAQAYARLAAAPLANVSLISADAEHVPLRDALADIVHSRFAYFFGPARGQVDSCEPGIQEALRLLKPTGVFVVIDNNLVAGDFARLVERYGYSSPSGARMQADRDVFWGAQGFAKQTIHSVWRAPDRAVLQRVIAMEFPTADIEAILSTIAGVSLSYAYDVYWRRK